MAFVRDAGVSLLSGYCCRSPSPIAIFHKLLFFTAANSALRNGNMAGEKSQWADRLVVPVGSCSNQCQTFGRGDLE